MPFGFHTLLLTHEGGLLGFGRSMEGQLGLGHQHNRSEPVEIPWNGPRAVQVSCGELHSLVLDEEGGVWEAGLPQTINFEPLVFKQVMALPLVTQIAAGEKHSAVLDVDGNLWWWTARSLIEWAPKAPERVPNLPYLFKLASGGDIIVAEAEEGLWVFGSNSQGQLGVGHTQAVLQPTLVDFDERVERPLRCLTAYSNGIVFLDSAGTVWTAGNNYFGQLGRPESVSVFLPIPDAPPMRSASCGYNHVLSLDETGGVWVWGRGDLGQLGREDTSNLSKPTLLHLEGGCSAIQAGSHHSMLFLHDGSFLVFGWNNFGQLGLKDSAKQVDLPTVSHLKPALPVSLQMQKSARF